MAGTLTIARDPEVAPRPGGQVGVMVGAACAMLVR